MEIQTYHAILLSACAATAIGWRTLSNNYAANKKHRNIIALMQLSRDFYQDSQFSRDRLELWIRLKSLPKEEHDYFKLIQRLGDKSSHDPSRDLTSEHIVALSRTAAFYNSVKGLIDSEETDIEMIRNFFGYNYNRFWNAEREMFATYSSTESDRRFFQEIPELKQDLPELGITDKGP